MAPVNGISSNHRGGLSRRSVLAVVAGGFGVLATTMIGLAVGFVSNAFGRRSSRSWIRIGPAEDLDPQTFRAHVISVERTHAWVRKRVPLVVYIRDYYPEDPVALLSTCSHLGCSVSWDAETSHFRCPCHGGVYNESGTVVDGPPPRPLSRLDVKIEDDICYLRLPDSEGKQA